MGNTRIVSGLAPCPFCGRSKIRVRYVPGMVFCTCVKCAATGPYFDAAVNDDGEFAEKQAIKAWNGRVAKAEGKE